MQVVRSNDLGTKLHVFANFQATMALCGVEDKKWGGPIIGTPINWQDFDVNVCCETCWEKVIGHPQPQLNSV